MLTDSPPVDYHIFMKEKLKGETMKDFSEQKFDQEAFDQERRNIWRAIRGQKKTIFLTNEECGLPESDTKWFDTKTGRRVDKAKSKIASLLKQAALFDLFAASWMLLSLLAFLCGVVMLVALTIQALIGMVFSS